MGMDIVIREEARRLNGAMGRDSLRLRTKLGKAEKRRKMKKKKKIVISDKGNKWEMMRRNLERRLQEHDGLADVDDVWAAIESLLVEGPDEISLGVLVLVRRVVSLGGRLVVSVESNVGAFLAVPPGSKNDLIICTRLCRELTQACGIERSWWSQTHPGLGRKCWSERHWSSWMDLHRWTSSCRRDSLGSSIWSLLLPCQHEYSTLRPTYSENVLSRRSHRYLPRFQCVKLLEQCSVEPARWAFRVRANGFHGGLQIRWCTPS